MKYLKYLKQVKTRTRYFQNYKGRSGVLKNKQAIITPAANFFLNDITIFILFYVAEVY